MNAELTTKQTKDSGLLIRIEKQERAKWHRIAATLGTNVSALVREAMEEKIKQVVKTT